MSRLAVSRKGLTNTERPTLSRKRCKRGHSYAKHGKKDSAGFLRCMACLAETKARYEAKKKRPKFFGVGVCPRCKERGVGLVSSREGPLCLECHPTCDGSEKR